MTYPRSMGHAQTPEQMMQLLRRVCIDRIRELRTTLELKYACGELDDADSIDDVLDQAVANAETWLTEQRSAVDAMFNTLRHESHGRPLPPRTT